MASSDLIELEGIITEACRGGVFRVKCKTTDTDSDGEHEILAHLSGKLRKHRIKVLVGDQVLVEVSPYDLSRGRITYRER